MFGFVLLTAATSAAGSHIRHSLHHLLLNVPRAVALTPAPFHQEIVLTTPHCQENGMRNAALQSLT